ncbi:Na+/H+ antiporter subunit E [Acidovorax lacteus]|uniref:Na+/H+ antiporter subunit E n=1 Tax=Acidovorax lacteus TaxID=1924988 RepID=UPI0031E55BB4
MKRRPLLAHPWWSALLGIGWLLLQRSIEPVHLLSAVLLGLAVPWLLHGFLPTGRPVRWAPVPRLVAVVLRDIVVSNIAVARLVLGPASRPRPGWVVVPLTLQDPTAIALLASIITTTPGTVSCTVDEAQHRILVHALDCADPVQMAHDIQQRYEAPLRAIFEGHGAHAPSPGARP